MQPNISPLQPSADVTLTDSERIADLERQLADLRRDFDATSTALTGRSTRAALPPCRTATGRLGRPGPASPARGGR